MTALTPEVWSERELIDAARDGDDRAFGELHSRYHPRIEAFIGARVRDHGKAEDLAQDVFISALRRLRSSTQPIHFKPWIYEIAKNACIDEYRRSRRSHEVSLDAAEDAGPARPLLSLAPTPAAAVETKQRLSDLRGAFGGLSESHHQLLVLREFEGLSYEEIGARTGMSRQMVESALFRARRKLSAEYEELASGRRCEQIQLAISEGRAVSARSFGLRERRQFARHLAHCQPCRVEAHLAGVDETLVRPARLGAKIAALVPVPLLRWPWSGGRVGRHGALRAASQSPSLHPLLNGAAEPAAASALGGAAVAATVLALAGAGPGTLPGVRAHRPTTAPGGVSAAPATPGSARVASSRAGAGIRHSLPRASRGAPRGARPAGALASGTVRIAAPTRGRRHPGGGPSAGGSGPAPGGASGADHVHTPSGVSVGSAAPTIAGAAGTTSRSAASSLGRTLNGPGQAAGATPLNQPVTQTAGHALSGAAAAAGATPPSQTVTQTAGHALSGAAAAAGATPPSQTVTQAPGHALSGAAAAAGTATNTLGASARVAGAAAGSAAGRVGSATSAAPAVPASVARTSAVVPAASAAAGATSTATRAVTGSVAGAAGAVGSALPQATGL